MITALNIVTWTLSFLLGLLISLIHTYWLRRLLKAERAKLVEIEASIEDIRKRLDTKADDLRTTAEGLSRIFESELKEKEDHSR